MITVLLTLDDFKLANLSLCYHEQRQDCGSYCDGNYKEVAVVPAIFLLCYPDDKLPEAGTESAGAVNYSRDGRRRTLVALESFLAAQVRGASCSNHIVQAAHTETEHEHQEVQKGVGHFENIDIDAKRGR